MLKCPATAPHLSKLAQLPGKSTAATTHAGRRCCCCRRRPVCARSLSKTRANVKARTLGAPCESMNTNQRPLSINCSNAPVPVAGLTRKVSIHHSAAGPPFTRLPLSALAASRPAAAAARHRRHPPMRIYMMQEFHDAALGPTEVCSHGVHTHG